MTTTTRTEPEATAEAVAERLFSSVLGAMEVQAATLGHRLGWYRELAGRDSATAEQLSDATGTNERYAREWLEQQAATGYLMVDDPGADPAERRYSISPGVAEVLCDIDSLNYMAPIADFVMSAGEKLSDLETAYRNGTGVSWADFGEETRQSQAAANRPLFLHALTQELIPQVPDLHRRLTEGALVADIGCGLGWSTIGIARGYPATTVHGYDIDEPSVAAAGRNAEEFGVSDRVAFATVDGASLAVKKGEYDVVLAFECVHDMADPVAVLSAMRQMAGSDGTVVIMDERTEEHFMPSAPEVERLLYGYSLICCLPDSMTASPTRATGTVMRPDTMRSYAREAGFKDAEVLPIEHDFFRFYRLTQ